MSHPKKGKPSNLYFAVERFADALHTYHASTLKLQASALAMASHGKKIKENLHVIRYFPVVVSYEKFRERTD